MFKPLCALLVGGLLGFGAWMQFSNDNVPKDIPKKVNPYEIGKTKAGEPCRLIAQWSKEYSNAKEFVRFNTEKEGEVDEFGLKYDCFLDLDTQEYKLVNYQKTEKIRGGYIEQYEFKNRDESAEWQRFQYYLNLGHSDGTIKKDFEVSGECTRHKFPLYTFIAIIVIVMCAVFALVIFI